MSADRFRWSVFWKPALAVLVTFAAVGFGTAHVIEHVGGTHGTPVAEIRLAAWMGGLFAGGAAATLVTLFLAFGRRRR